MTACSKKQCSKCKEVLEASFFYRDNRTTTGLSSRCKECQRNASRKSWRDNRENNLEKNRRGHLRRKYGITQDDYLRMLKSQGGKCAICRQPEELERNQKLCVDHCHTTGAVRGLLCDACNRGIGSMRDDVSILTAAIKYLSAS